VVGEPAFADVIFTGRDFQATQLSVAILYVYPVAEPEIDRIVEDPFTKA
jgi:hypothetical protein